MSDATKAMVEALQFARTDITAAIKFVEHDLGDGEARGLRQTLMRIEAALTAAKSEWQPISTAPKDKRPILVFVRASRVPFQEEPDTMHIAFLKRANTYALQDDDHTLVTPTHWQPLPELPQP